MAVLTQKVIGGVEWSKNYLWECKFETVARSQIRPPSAPFNGWFPATDVDEGLHSINSYSFNTGLKDYKIPLNTSSKQIRLTFHDDVNNTLLNWLNDWMKAIVPNDQYVAHLDQILLSLVVQKLNAQKEVISGQTNSYLVYPEDTLTFTGSSESRPTSYVISFHIVDRS